MKSRTVSQQLEANSRAGLAAHEAYVRETTGSVQWDRRGWLGRLVRTERAPQQVNRQRGRDSAREDRLVA
jgi:hypothetical protein